MDAEKPQDKFRSREQEATLGLLRTADAVKRSLAHLIEPHGITPQQYNVLRILRGAGPDGLPTLTYQVRLKKRCGPDSLLGALRERLGPQLTEYSPHQSGAEVQGTAT